MVACPNCGHAFHPKACAPCPPEPPIGTWVQDRFGATHYRVNDLWAAAPTGFYAFGKWEAMWESRGPLTECGPWGAALTVEVTG